MAFTFNGPGERWGQRSGAAMAGEEFDPRVAAGNRGTAPLPAGPAQFNNFPDYVPPKADTSALDSYQKTLPQLFNTKGASAATQAAIRSMMAMGQSTASAAGAAYGNRAMQVGASPLGAGFAQAQAMLPAYNQRAQMLEALQRLKLSAATGQAGALGGVAEQMARLAAQANASRQAYATNQQQLGESQREFDVSRADRLEQQAYARQQQQAALQRQLASGEPGAGRVGAGAPASNDPSDIWAQLFLNNQSLNPQAAGNAQRNFEASKLIW